jgi:putative PIN family toxin of toxin-antitoxin system
VTAPVAVVDTNVVVSGLITSARGSPTAVILDAMLAGRFSFLLSVELLAEYREVLLRPAIRRHHGLADAEVDAVLTDLAMNGILHEPGPAASTPPDPGDDHVWALLETPAAILVTGDEALRRRAPDPARVLSPRDFLRLL